MLAAELCRRNGHLSGAFWETLCHVKVILRSTLAERMIAGQHRGYRNSS